MQQWLHHRFVCLHFAVTVPFSVNHGKQVAPLRVTERTGGTVRLYPTPSGCRMPDLHCLICLWVNSAIHFQHYQTWTSDKHLPELLRQDPVDFSKFPALFFLASWRSPTNSGDLIPSLKHPLLSESTKVSVVVQRKVLHLPVSIPAFGIIFMPKVTRRCIDKNASTFAYNIPT